MTTSDYVKVWVGGAIAVLFGYLVLVVLFTSGPA